MKTFHFFLLCLLFPFFQVSAQQPCTTFDCVMQGAKAAFEAGDYRKAYDEFKSARRFERADLTEVNTWIDQTFDALEKRERAGAQSVSKVLDRLYFYNNRFGLAFDPVNERYGFIDKSGRTLIPFKFHTLSPFDAQGFARGRKAEGQGWRTEYLVDTLGNSYRLATEVGQLDSTTRALDLRNRGLASLPDAVCHYTQLEILLLNNNELSALPKDFGNLTHLKILYLHNNKLSALPAGFGGLNALQTLTLNDNQLAALPTDFGRLKNLEYLLLHANQLNILPDNFGSLAALRLLRLSGNHLSRLPDSFGQLHKLEYLTMVGNQLTALPETFSQLTNLSWLEANFNRLTQLPEDFGRLSRLRHLYLSGNQLSSLPASFGQLTGLQTLEAFNNLLTGLPAEFGQLQNLQGLSLTYNRITRLPESFVQLNHLQKLGMASNQLSVLPNGFGQLKDLTYLDLANNKLSSLPADIGTLTKLLELYVNNNQLGSLPGEIGHLQALTTLFAGENRLATLPASLCNLSRLELLSYTKNPIRELPPCIKNMAAQPPPFEAILEALGEEPSDSTAFVVARQLLKSGYEKAYKNDLAAIRADSTDPSSYFSLSYHALFVDQYQQAIAAAQKTLQLNPQFVKVETNLALGYLLNNRYDLALPVYKKWKGKKFEAADQDLADAIFLKDIAELEDMGVKHPDFQKVKDLFSK